ncbi:hypothetical protein ACIBI9_16255 [Nonomuraea sp. NPDC050451]|uniref:hypothetical protein n=1 Tax=Nonomuraea sp. NPDC050451 TaxID=3364364 RepID=UPI00378B3E14
MPGSLSVWAGLGVGARTVLIVRALGSDPGFMLIIRADSGVGGCAENGLVVGSGLGLGGGARSVLILGVAPEKGVSAGAFPIKGAGGLLNIDGYVIAGADIVLSVHGGTHISRIAHGGMHSVLHACGGALVVLFACGGGVVGVFFLVCLSLG